VRAIHQLRQVPQFLANWDNRQALWVVPKVEHNREAIQRLRSTQEMGEKLEDDQKPTETG
jgi:hypothetical protein